MKKIDLTKNVINNIHYIYCDDSGNFDCYGNITDLCVLYSFITYKLLKHGIKIEYLINSMANANDLYNDLNKE